jgi:hypothetical protein
MTVEKTLLYFKLRFEGREMKFEHEFRNLPFNDEAGLTARFRVSKLQDIAVSSEKTVVGMLMTLINSFNVGATLSNPSLQDRSRLHRKWG